MTKDPIKDWRRYRQFLETIPLDKYRAEFQKVKWVEQDLPKEILPLASIFKYYWEERQFLTFEEWFETFWQEINTAPQCKEVLDWFKKYYFDKDNDGWFKKGFKARMYRTWVLCLLNLIFAMYLSLFVPGKVKVYPLNVMPS